MRMTVKNNRLLLGFEEGFGLLDGSTEGVADIGDVDFVVNTESVSLTDIKPKTERYQPWYVNNATRKPSMTYDSDFKFGSGSFEGDLKFGHLFDAVIGGAVSQDMTTYDRITISGGDRKSMFAHFAHGSKRSRQIIGALVNTLTVDFKEGDFVKFTADVLSKKTIDVDPITDSIAAFEAVDYPVFHWKHVSIGISFDNMNSFYNVSSRNYIESSKLTIKNETEYKNGSQADVGSEYANYYKEKLFDSEIELTLYPEDEVPWLFDPSQSKYSDYGTKGSITYDTLVGSFVVGETVTGGTSGSTGVVVAVWTSTSTTGVIFITNKSDSFESEETITTASGSASITAPYQGFGLSITGTDPSGLSGATSYYLRVNNEEYTITTVASLTYADIAALIDTAISADDMECAIISGDIVITSSSGGPETISISAGDTPDLLSSLTGYTEVSDPKCGFNAGHIRVRVLLYRDVHDFIQVDLNNLHLDPVTEDFENIESGVDPLTMTARFAKSTSDIDVIVEHPLHDNSFSDKY